MLLEKLEVWFGSILRGEKLIFTWGVEGWRLDILASESVTAASPNHFGALPLQTRSCVLT